MATRTLNVLLTADSKGMATGFASSIKSSMGLKAGLAAAALGAAALGKELYNIGEEYDEATDKIRISTGKTGKQLEKLEGDFKNVVSSVPTDFEAAADAVGELNKRLGITGKPLRERSKQFLELSRITDTDVSENVKSVTRAFGDWEVQTAKQGKQLDKFFRASQGSGASVAELSDLTVKFGAPLRQVGFSLDEATALFASFEKAGVNTTTMMPGLKMAMRSFFEEDLDPKEGLRKTFKGIEDGTIKTSEALKIFGTRAGGDMVEAVNQGRFQLDAFTKTIATGNDTIRKAGKETMDTSENMQLLGNKIKILVVPAANWLYNAVGNVSKAFATMNFKPLLRDLGLTEDEMKSVGAIARAMGRVFTEVVVPLVKGALGSVKNQLQGFANFMKSIVKIVGGVLRGDFGEAWDGVKDLFRTGVDFVKGLMKGLTAPMRLAAKAVDKALTGVFGGTWDTIKGFFEDGANAAISVLNKMIGLMNKVPFIDIGEVGYLGGGGGGSRAQAPKGGAPGGGKFGLQRGGPINLGAPSGDTVPAMLERGEYVLNRNAVKAVGARTLDAINYGAAPRFQQGGPVQHLSIGSIVKDVAGYTPPGLAIKGAKAAWSKGFPAVASAASGIAGMAGGFPNWVDGSYFVDAAVDWLKGKTQAQAKERRATSAPGGGPLGKASGAIGAAMDLATSMGLQITSGWPLGTPGVHAPTSYHYQSGRAFDTAGSAGQMMAFALTASSRWGAKMAEMFYDPLGWYIKHGARIPGAIGGHSDHVHVAMQRGGLAGAFLQKAGKVWGAAKGLFPGATRMPHMTLANIPGAVTAEDGSYLRFGKGPAGRFLDGDNSAESMLLHEWAHHFQDKSRANVPWLQEGGAEAFAKWAGPQVYGKLGWPHAFAGWPPYAKSARNVQASKGNRWIRKGQFGFQGGGIVGTIGSILMRNGLDKEAAAGIIGNAYGESGYDPGAMEPGTHNGGLWGFTASPVSLQDLKNYAESQGMPWTSAKAQTQFLLHHLGIHDSGFKDKLNAAGSVAETTEMFMSEWERPANMSSLGKRTGAAERALKALGGLVSGGKAGKRKTNAGKARGDGKTGGMQAPANAAKGPNTEPKRPVTGGGSVPKILQGLGMGAVEDIFKMPGLTDWKKSELALTAAGRTKQTWDDRQVQKFQLNLGKTRNKAIQKEVNRLNKRLSTEKLTDKQRSQILQKRDGLLGQLGTWGERIDTAREGLRGEPLEGIESGEAGEGGEDPAVKAAEENTRAMEEHTAAIKGLQDEMKRQTDFATSATATSSGVAWKALADILSGNLGGTAQQAAQLAGAGSIGSVGRF